MIERKREKVKNGRAGWVRSTAPRSNLSPSDARDLPRTFSACTHLRVSVSGHIFHPKHFPRVRPHQYNTHRKKEGFSFLDFHFNRQTRVYMVRFAAKGFETLLCHFNTPERWRFTQNEDVRNITGCYRTCGLVEFSGHNLSMVFL